MLMLKLSLATSLFLSGVSIVFGAEAAAQSQITVLQNFDGEALPRNGDGDHPAVFL